MPRAKTRTSEVSRETKETAVSVRLNLDGHGRVKIETPLGFMNHMLIILARHALFDLVLTAEGDLEVDAHHTVEDVGLVLGEALFHALGEKKGIQRFGAARVPMDEALAEAVIDLSGRPCLVYGVKIPARKQWEFDCHLVKEFFQALANAGRFTFHLHLISGDNYHHCCEALFKAAGRALRQAVEFDPRSRAIPSTKGSL